MTNFIYPTYIFNRDIKIRPEILIEKIYKLINKEINDISFEDTTSKIQLKYITYLYKEIKQMFGNYHFWKEVCSYNFCSYQIRNPKDEKDKGKMCGRRIDKKLSYDNKSEKYFCSEHDRNHRKFHSKPIEKKVNETYCNNINKDGAECKHISKINGLCMKHHKYIYKINKEEILNRILFYKNYTDINLELNLLSNIKIEKCVLQNHEVKKNEDIKKIRRVSYQNSENIESTPIAEINNNINNNTISISDNASISNSILNAYNRLEELNKTITENSNIFTELINSNKLSYHKDCESKGCTNSKQYNIIYNKYCKHHIHNRPKAVTINFFNQRKSNSPITTFTNNNLNNS
jgi:hypothetical protein